MKITKQAEVITTNSDSINNIATVKVIETDKIDKLRQNRKAFIILGAIALFGLLVTKIGWLKIASGITTLISFIYLAYEQTKLDNLPTIPRMFPIKRYFDINNEEKLKAGDKLKMELTIKKEKK